MQYSLDNFTISMFQNMATELRSRGWNVFWHASGETEAFTSGSLQGTISLIEKLPHNPTFITHGSVGNLANQAQIVLPAFAIEVQPPRRLKRMGLGDETWEREIDIRIAGLTSDARQQSALATLFYDWLQIGDDDYYMPVSDYTVPGSPVTLDPAEVWWAHLTTPEVVIGTDTIRYQINIDLVLRYVE